MTKEFIIGIDLGGTNLKIALLDSRYKINDRRTFSTRKFDRKKSLILAIVDSINGIIKDNHLRKREILGVGLGLPGPIDVERGIVHFFPNIPGWKEVNLKKILEERLKLPVFLDNDANLMSLAEHRRGAAQGLSDVVCLTLGTGVGGGIIINKSLYRGKSFAAGEIGHIPINEIGPRCNCGGIACLEAYIGNKRITKVAKELFKRNVSLEKLSQMAREKNRQALKIWSQMGRYLGIALVGVVNLFNPEAIVIGGGVAGAGKVLFDQVKETILKRAMRVQAKELKIFKAKLGNDAGLIGAAMLVKDSFKRYNHEDFY